MVLLLKMLHSQDGEFSRGLRLTRSHIYIVPKLLWSLLETCGRQARREGLISHSTTESDHELYGEWRWLRQSGIAGRRVTINMSRECVLHHSSSDSRSGP